MSATLLTVRNNVHTKLRNFAGAANLVPQTVMNDAITSTMQTMAAQMDLGLVWTTSAITTTPGTREYAISNSAGENNKILLLRCATTGAYPGKTTPEAIEVWRHVPSTNTGEPSEFALIEAAPGSVGAQTVTVLLGPTPDAVYVYDVLRTLTPVTLAADTDAIPFGEAGLRALELFAAAEIIDAATDSLLTERGLSRGAAAAYRSRAEDAFYWERTRQGRQKRVATIPVQMRRY